MAKLLVIIPAYNEEAAILTTLADLQTNCPEADWVVVNDCSRDGTRELLRSSRASYLDLPVNLGIGGGVQTGYKYAVEHGYDLTVQFDGDGQHRADCIRELIAPIVRGEADMTVGSRFLPEAGEQDRGFQSSAARRLGIRWISGLIRLTTGRTIHDVTSGFRACGKELTAYFAQNYAQDYPEPEAIVSALYQGMRVQEVPVRMNQRQGGVSSIRALDSLHYMLKVSLAIMLAGLRLTGRRKERKA